MAERLCAASFAERVFFANSGSEANDTALKFIRYYWNLQGKTSKKIHISREYAYHGVTMAAASLSGLTPMHPQWDLPLPGFVKVPTAYWYMFGEGKDPNEYGLQVARKLEEKDRRKLAEFLGVGESELGAPEEKSYLAASRGPDWVEVGRLPLGASAGAGALAAHEAPFDAFRFSRRWLRQQGLEGARLAAITVEGDSMEPVLRAGDEILVDRAPRPFRDGIHVVRVGEHLMVKRLASAGPGRLTLLSQNLAYPPIEVAADEVEIVGRVVWKSGRI